MSKALQSYDRRAFLLDYGCDSYVSQGFFRYAMVFNKLIMRGTEGKIMCPKRKKFIFAFRLPVITNILRKNEI